ncbi:hypothetical protein Tco_0993313 [Tanacetum coccineum]|uniref:Uncharacterized protein n=1 Tax=Tanacetum coccineum TaxID=301880 RepID=A0ABQ5F536_9ASTR
MLHASGSSDGVGSQPKVPDESEDKTTGTDKGTSTIPGVPYVPKYQSESDDESWGESEDDNDNDSEDDNDDNNDDVSKGDNDKANSDNDGSDTHDNERTDSDDDDENPLFTLKDYDEEDHKEEYESDNDYENMFKKEDDDLYKDVNVRSLGTEHEKERKDDVEMTEKTDDLKQSSSVSSDFANQFLILEKAPPSDHEVTSLMNIKMSHEVPSTHISSPFTETATVILDSSTIASTTAPPTISMISHLPQLTTPTPAPITDSTTISIPALLDFSSLFGLDQRVSTLETELSQLKQADLSTQLLKFSYTQEFEKKAQEKRKLYIDVVEKLVKDIIKDEVKSLLPHIPPKEVSDFATCFELKKIRLEKLEKSKSYRVAEAHRNLYDALVKSYQLDKDLFDSYGKAYHLKRSHEDKDKDEDPPAEPDQGLKKRKTSKDVEPPRSYKLKDSQSSSSKGTKSLPKSSRKSVQVEEPMFETADTEMPQDQGEDMAYVMNHLKINNLTQQHLVGPTFNLLKGTCKSRVKLEYHFEECYKVVTDHLDWTNLEGHQHVFNLSKPLPLIEVQGRQKKKNYVKVIKKYNYRYLEEIEVQRDDNTLYKFKEGDFLNLNLRDIKDMLLLLVQKKISNLERDVIFDLNVALWIFTRSIVILKRVEDLQLGVKSYQKKTNITKHETFRSDISKLTPTLTSVQRVLHDIASSLEMDYLPKRTWSKLDRKRSRIVIKLIDQQLFERRLMRNLEKFIGGREYGNDFRLLERII